MKSINTINSMSPRGLKSNQKWIDDLKEEMQKIKKPFLNRVQFSKLKIQNKIRQSKVEKQDFLRSDEAISNLIQKQKQNESTISKQKYQNTQQSQDLAFKKQSNQLSVNKKGFEDEIHNQKAKSMQTKSHITEWKGRDKERIFKNSSSMIEQFQTVFNKKLPSNQSKNQQIFSYRKDQKQMLQKIFQELKDSSQNVVQFRSIYKFFEKCPLFFTVYDINPSELQDLVCQSAHVYSDKLTKKQFFDFLLVNPQSRKYDEFQDKVQKTCCFEQQYWDQLKQLFSQLDTFGCGTVNTSQFFHKMKTVSASMQLLNANTIYYPNVKRYYPLKKVIFQLENKIKLPSKLDWSKLKAQIINFSHTNYPSIDEIYQKRIKSGNIGKDANTFLLKAETIAILKKQFARCPKFCESFVKCKYFCSELLSMESINYRKTELVRQNNDRKRYVNLLSNIRMLQLKGPEYFDIDQMLIYFSVKGFQQQQNLRHFKESFDTKSTASDEEFQERKKQERRLRRMKSQDHIKKIMMKNSDQYQGTQRKKHFIKPVKVQEFNLTKPKDYLTIREIKVKEMIEQKRLKQQAQIKPFIVAHPLPASINSQRYQQERNKKKIKRELQKQRFNKKYEKYNRQLSYLQATTKLFDKSNQSNKEQENKFLLSPSNKNHFQSKPIAWFVKQRNLLEIIQGEKEERKKNRLKQTRQKYQYGYWKNMPYQCDERQISQQESKNQHEDSLEIQVKKIKDDKVQNTQQKIKTTEVPDFAKLQKQFMFELNSKKRMKSPTVVKEFNLSVSKKKPLQNQQQIVTKRSQTPIIEKNQTSTRANKSVIIGTTKKYESMVQLTQMKIAQKNYEQESKKLQQKQRKKKQKAFAKFMNKILRQENLKSKRQSADKTTRRNDSSSRREHKSQLKKIYEKVLSRPFLFQIASQESKGLKKRGKNSKKSKRLVPQKVKIPTDNLYAQIPPLRYVDSEEYPVQYENQRNHFSEQEEPQYFANQFQEDSHLQQQESYVQQAIPNQTGNYKRNNYTENLNQSF